jgi:glycosyltransferase A (GT-A) superfamily protein (DUF2064 family)
MTRSAQSDGGRTAVGVLARAPAEGRIASRLLAAHSPRWVAGLYAAMLRDTLDGLQSLDAARYVVFVAPLPGDADASAAIEIVARHAPAPWEVVAQTGADVGARMTNAIATLCAGGTRAVLVAADAPSLPTEPIAKALANGDDVVLGPGKDGTYWLVALRAPEPRLFSEMPWKTPALLDATRARAREVGLSVRELDPWYRVDDPGDVLDLIEELRRHPERAPRTAQFMVTHA